MIRSIATIALISAAALTAGAVQAQTVENAQMNVSTVNVDFNNARQARAFYSKLNAAANSVCTSEVSDPMTAMADAQCARDAVSNAVREINAPKLSALDAQQRERAPAYAERQSENRRN